MAKARLKTLSKNKAINTLTIDTNLINKEEVFRMLALGHATGLPVLLIGPPGTAKTKTVIDYAKAFAMAQLNATEQNATKHFVEKVFLLETDEGTKASEVKGMPDLEELFTNNKYKLLTPITESEIVIINEVDKASAAIRNSLLGIMNEKHLFNGKSKIPCKWKLFVATCNSIPKEEIHSPFWDRFILKVNVERISAGDMVKYFEKGGKNHREQFTIGIPNQTEMDELVIPINKLEKYLEVGYSQSSDRSLTFLTTLAKAIAFIWNISVDKCLVKIASMMINQGVASQLQDLLMSPEVKSLSKKVELLWSINTIPELDAALEDVETILTGYAAQGKIDETQVADMETAIQYVLENHELKKKQDLEEVLSTIGELDSATNAVFG